MKTKELPKQVRDKVVEKYRLGYKKISETLNKPAKRRQPTKTHRPGKGGINQRGNKETKDNPEGAAKIHSGESVHRTTLSRTLHRAGLYRRVARKKAIA
jgi:hypothetical protein